MRSQTSIDINYEIGKPNQSKAPVWLIVGHKDLDPHLVIILFTTVFPVPYVVGTQETCVE